MAIKNDIKEIFSSESLRNALEKDFHVEIAILFGSITDDRRKDPQDIDLGLLFRKHLPRKKEEKLLQRLRNLLKVDKLDVICLNHASPSLRYEVVRNGILLYESLEDRYINFIIKTFKDYEEMNFLKRHYYKARVEELRGVEDVQP